MRTTPHRIRVLSKSAQVVLAGSVSALVLLAAIAASRSDEGKGVYLLVICAGIVSALIVLLTAGHAAATPPALRMWPGSASVVITRTPEEVWACVRPAETAHLLQPIVHRGFTVPGTPAGVGEQQCFVVERPDRALEAHVVEVVEEEDGCWAVVRSVTGPPTTQRYEVVPAAMGAQFTYSVEVAAPRWAVFKVHPRKLPATAAESYAASVKQLVESQRPPDPSGALSTAPPLS